LLGSEKISVTVSHAALISFPAMNGRMIEPSLKCKNATHRIILLFQHRYSLVSGQKERIVLSFFYSFRTVVYFFVTLQFIEHAGFYSF
jgi:hypothetical protein